MPYTGGGYRSSLSDMVLRPPETSLSGSFLQQPLPSNMAGKAGAAQGGSQPGFASVNQGGKGQMGMGGGQQSQQPQQQGPMQ